MVESLHVNRFQRPQKAAAVLANTLIRIMFSEDYVVGDRLPTEAEMLKEFEVGRGTLREALRLLESQGLITIGQGRNGGPIITKPSYNSLADYMANAYCANQTTVEELLSARSGIEPVVAYEAALHRTDQSLVPLRNSLSRMRGATAKDDVFLEENSAFHQLLAEASGNPVYIIVAASLKTVHDGHSVGVGFSRRSLQAAQKRHENILLCVERHDADGAQREMQLHMQEFQEFVRTRYPHILSKRITPLGD